MAFISLFKITVSFSITLNSNPCYESLEDYEKGFEKIDKNKNNLLELKEYEESCAYPFLTSQFEKIDKSGKGF